MISINYFRKEGLMLGSVSDTFVEASPAVKEGQVKDHAQDILCFHAETENHTKARSCASTLLDCLEEYVGTIQRHWSYHLNQVAETLDTQKFMKFTTISDYF